MHPRLSGWSPDSLTLSLSLALHPTSILQPTFPRQSKHWWRIITSVVKIRSTKTQIGNFISVLWHTYLSPTYFQSDPYLFTFMAYQKHLPLSSFSCPLCLLNSQQTETIIYIWQLPSILTKKLQRPYPCFFPHNHPISSTLSWMFIIPSPLELDSVSSFILSDIFQLLLLHYFYPIIPEVSLNLLKQANKRQCKTKISLTLHAFSFCLVSLSPY